jgi:chemotaxis protein methyltransferase CheR
MGMKDIVDVESIEIELLLEAIYRHYGYDFRSYARASISRRVRQFMALRGVSAPGELIPLVLRDEECFSQIAQHFSICVTEMFRDPFFYTAFRQQVVPILRTYPFFKQWHAGCATGEEVYSMAILLKEEGLYGRAMLYGTDFNDQALDTARQGIYSPEQIQAYTTNYQAAGGTGSFAAYYSSKYQRAGLQAALRERITFANHNLVTDAVFGEMHVVCCRNVLIYFNDELQDRVLQLFTDSLVRGGFLCLGAKEDIRFTAVADAYETVDARARIFKKKMH